MGTGGKKKRQEDFKKVKLKVGRTVKKQLNETKINLKAKQIVIKESSLYAAHPLKALISSSRTRGNTAVKLVALVKISEHFSTIHLEEFTDEVVAVLSKYLMDSDHRIRTEAIKCIKLFVELMKVNRRDLTPVFKTIVAYIKCALTHLDPGIVQDGQVAFGFILDFTIANQDHLAIDQLLSHLATVILSRLLTIHGTSADEGDFEIAEKFTRACVERKEDRNSSIKPPVRIVLTETSEIPSLPYDAQSHYWMDVHDEIINFSFPEMSQDNSIADFASRLIVFVSSFLASILTMTDVDHDAPLRIYVKEAQKLIFSLRIIYNLSLFNSSLDVNSVLQPLLNRVTDENNGTNIVIQPRMNVGGNSSKLLKLANRRDEKNSRAMVETICKLVSQITANS